MKLFGSTKKTVDKAKNREKVPSLEVVELVLVQCNLVDNQYQQKSEVFYRFMSLLLLLFTFLMLNQLI